METKDTTRQKKSHRVRNIILIVILALLLIGTAVGVSYLYRILKKPESLFTDAAATKVPEQSALAPAFDLPTDRTPAAYATPSAEQATSSPTDVPANPEDASPKGILNILLTGIDAYESGKTTSGTMPHTDAMMVIAINFDNDTIDLISLPRDTFTTVPGHSGFYKLNAVFNVGMEGKKFKSDGSDDLANGFELTCRAAEQWLGGISIPYYYGVDFQAVIDIVDAIGGIDYDVDQIFRSMSGKRTYGTGMHHLDGDAVLGYLRIRWLADGLDSSRTARQRRMMVAIFKKLKNESKLSQIPALISAANSGIYTNTTLAQTTALVNYAKSIDSESIRTKAMYGDIGKIEYHWRFAYVDQQNRLDLIKEVYGIDAEPVGTCTRQYERWLRDVGFETIKRIHQLEKILKTVQEKKDAGETFTDEQIALYTDCYMDYKALYDAYEAHSKELAAVYGTTAWREKPETSKDWTDQNIRQDQELTKKEKAYINELNEIADKALISLKALAAAIDYHKISWNLYQDWWKDSDINEVYVTFG